MAQSNSTVEVDEQVVGRKGWFALSELQDLGRHREVFLSLLNRDFKGRYRAKMLGILWSIGDPLIMMFIYTLVFTYFFKRFDIYAYPVVLLLGLTPHRFMANGITAATSSILQYSMLVRQVAFPRHLLPLAALASSGIHFLIEIGLLIIVSLFYPGALQFSTAMVWLPLVLLVQLLYMTGMGFLGAALNVRFRDTEYILASSMLVLYWLTPIFYPASFIPEKLRTILSLNPMVGVVTGYRRILMEGQPPDASMLGIGAAVALVLFIVGLSVFRRNQGMFADYV